MDSIVRSPLRNPVVDSSGGGSSPIVAPENYGVDAKPSGSGVTAGSGGTSWTDVVVNSTIPHVEMTNPDLIYQGNGRYLNDYGATITVKGFISANVYSSGIQTNTFQFTVGLWDGVRIVEDAAKAVSWGGIRSVNQPSSSSGRVFSYEIDVPDGEIFGFSKRRTGGNGTMQLYGWQHTVRAL